MKQRILVVIPAYNEEKAIASILEHLRRVAPEFDRVVVNEDLPDAAAVGFWLIERYSAVELVSELRRGGIIRTRGPPP